MKLKKAINELTRLADIADESGFDVLVVVGGKNIDTMNVITRSHGESYLPMLYCTLHSWCNGDRDEMLKLCMMLQSGIIHLDGEVHEK